MLILESADHDPLKAQQIETDLSAAWWHRYMLYRQLYGSYMAEQERKSKRQSRR